MAKNAGESRPGVRDRGVHAFTKELRCACDRLLRGQEANVRGANTERVYSRIAGGVVQEDQATRNQGLSLRESAGEEIGQVGRWSHGGEDGGVSLVKAEAHRAVRVRGMDG